MQDTLNQAQEKTGRPWPRALGPCTGRKRKRWCPRPIRRYLCTTNQLERVAKEAKRRTKVVEVFCREEAVKKLLDSVLCNLNERSEGRWLRSSTKALIGIYIE
ncbi:MAG: transposase [Candidatus Bathyarchaeia archaeon]